MLAGALGGSSRSLKQKERSALLYQGCVVYSQHLLRKENVPFSVKKMTKETHTPDLNDMCPFYLKHRLGQLCNSQGQRPPGVLPALLASVWRLVAIQHPAFTAHTRGPLTAPVIFTMDAGKLGGQARWTAGGRPPGRHAAARTGTSPRARAGGSGRGAGPHGRTAEQTRPRVCDHRAPSPFTFV